MVLSIGTLPKSQVREYPQSEGHFRNTNECLPCFQETFRNVSWIYVSKRFLGTVSKRFETVQNVCGNLTFLETFRNGLNRFEMFWVVSKRVWNFEIIENVLNRFESFWNGLKCFETCDVFSFYIKRFETFQIVSKRSSEISVIGNVSNRSL